MTSRAHLLLLLAACGAPKTTERAIENTRPAPPAMAPHVARDATGLTAAHVPAITADGRRLVAAFHESDGDRGLPNLTLVVRDRQDAEVERHVVLSLAEADQFLDDAEGKNPALDARVADANAWLAKRGFVAIDDGDGVTVTWESSRVRVAEGARVLVDRETPAAWVPAPTGDCVHRARLAGAAIAKAHRVVLVTITYDRSGGPRCLAPNDQHHVVSW